MVVLERAHAVAAQIGGMSKELLQAGRTWPSTQVQEQPANALVTGINAMKRTTATITRRIVI
ncbi:hypothetical protein [Bradyrhizobium sp. 1]|uniref:hypothetical protein n=1 Tax=Bradyrhizobium sp. 1 TaxID=241591 RepID=UPI001FFB7D44|nr:hypothetical protein [Bradyrhizobium sp. 1]MCK1396161.1 hypothetical protein [Bradyrhizobium sp. 1]